MGWLALTEKCITWECMFTHTFTNLGRLRVHLLSGDRWVSLSVNNQRETRFGVELCIHLILIPAIWKLPSHEIWGSAPEVVVLFIYLSLASQQSYKLPWFGIVWGVVRSCFFLRCKQIVQFNFLWTFCEYLWFCGPVVCIDYW